MNHIRENTHDKPKLFKSMLLPLMLFFLSKEEPKYLSI